MERKFVLFCHTHQEMTIKMPPQAYRKVSQKVFLVGGRTTQYFDAKNITVKVFSHSLLLFMFKFHFWTIYLPLLFVYVRNSHC